MGQVLTIQQRGLSQGLPVFLVAVQCGQAGAMLEPWRDLRGALIKTGNQFTIDYFPNSWLLTQFELAGVSSKCHQVVACSGVADMQGAKVTVPP